LAERITLQHGKANRQIPEVSRDKGLRKELPRNSGEGLFFVKDAVTVVSACTFPGGPSQVVGHQIRVPCGKQEGIRKHPPSCTLVYHFRQSSRGQNQSLAGICDLITVKKLQGCPLSLVKAVLREYPTRLGSDGEHNRLHRSPSYFSEDTKKGEKDLGHQQLLLLSLSVILVSVAVAAGMTMFVGYAVSVNRDVLTNDLLNLASRAQIYYRRPVALGGGGGSFTAGGMTGQGLVDIRQLTSKPSNSNGRYILGTVSDSRLTLTGIGTEIAGPGATDTVMVVMAVTPDSATVTSIK